MEIQPEDSACCSVEQVGVDGNYTTTTYIFPSIRLDASDTRSEKIHTYDSAALLLIMALLFLTVVTIWVFKVRRFRIMHETGLSLIYGILIGLALQYLLPGRTPAQFHLAKNVTNNSNCSSEETAEDFQVGQDIDLISEHGDTFSCEILHKVFEDESGNYIRQQLLFDPEIFFFALLPPIIFYAGYSLAKRHFFRNLGSLLLYAFAGTTISCFIIGGLMYGYTLSGAETAGSAFANLTGNPIPSGFGKSIIPSLLFGSLISATDPVTVLAIFHDLHVDHDLFSLVFGESVMNDAVAIVLFRSIDEFNEGGDFKTVEVLRSIGVFIGVFLGSFLLGCAMGLLTALLMKFSKLRDFPLLETSMFFIMSYSTYLLAEFAQLTGIVAVLFCGIMQSHYTYINLSYESRRRTKEVFELLNFLAENFIFAYMGLSLFTYSNHQWVPGFILFSFVGIFAGRVINIYVLSFVLNLARAKKISFRFQHMLVFAGLRGAIAFALAIRNTQEETRQLIFTTTLVIVMVTVFVCGGLTTLVLQLLRIKVGLEDESDTFNEDGDEIPYNPKSGNWFIAKFSRIDKHYLIPVFTHHGRSIAEFCPTSCVPFCTRCKPEPEDLEPIKDESSESEEDEEEPDERENVLSFRNAPQDMGGYADGVEEGDLGLGTEGKRTYQGGYEPLLNSREESSL